MTPSQLLCRTCAGGLGEGVGLGTLLARHAGLGAGGTARVSAPEVACWQCRSPMVVRDDRVVCESCGWWVARSQVCPRCGRIMVPDEDDTAFMACLHCGYALSGREDSEAGQILETWQYSVRIPIKRRSGGRRRKWVRKRVRRDPWYRRWGLSDY